MDDDETTPLLGSNPTTELRLLPAVNQAALRVVSLNLEHLRFEDLVNHARLHAENHSTQVAFALAVLLHLWNAKKKSSQSHDLYERWLETKAGARDATLLEKQIVDIWALYLAEYRQIHDIETVLWTQFPLDEGENIMCSVVKMLADFNSPAPLSSHPVVMSSLEYTWKRGLFTGSTSEGSSTLLRRYDMLSTPRVLHIIDWASHVLFLGLLIHYILYPIEQPHTSNNWLDYNYGVREIFLVLLPLSFITQSRTFVNSSSLLAALAFLISIPSAPHPGNSGFVLLQWAVFLQPFALNSPEVPSHMFFLQQHRVLPPALLLLQGLRRVLCPVILFFLPLVLLAVYLLSLSLTDVFFTRNTSLLLINPSALNTRFTFLCLFFAIVISVCVSMLVLGTTTPASHNMEDPWDRYSIESGRSARRASTRATMAYIKPYTFPPPFNLAHIFFIWLPGKVMDFFFTHPPSLTIAEQIIWRLTVGPLSAMLAILFWRPKRRN